MAFSPTLAAPPPTRREQVFRAALAHCKARRLAEAAALLKGLIAEDARDSRALLLLGSVLMDSEPAVAEGYLERCLAITPDDALAVHSLGMLKQRAGSDANAIELFRRAIALKPDFAPTFNDLATSLRTLGDYLAALAALERAIAVDPAYLTAQVNRGLVLMELRRNDEAREAFRAMLDAQPQSVDAWHSFAVANYQLSNIEPAIAACWRALRGDPAFLPAYATLAQALERAHRYDEARIVRGEWAKRQGLVVKRPCLGPREAARVLVIGGADQCNIPSETLLDRQKFATATLTLVEDDGHTAGEISAAAGPCDIVFNVVGDADRGTPFLGPVAALCPTFARPLINPPERIPPTRRDNLPALLQGVPGLVVPAMQRLARGEVADGATALLGRGPVLLRPIGVHGGDDLVRIADASEIPAYLDAVQADTYYLSEFHDYRSRDGYFRKYRLIFVDREVFPYHLAIGRDWMLHYWRVDMDEWMKREEEAFLADHASIFRGAAAAALTHVARRLDLDYAGIDCALLEDGRVLLFEANATMLVRLGDASEAGRNEPVRRIIDRMSRLLLERAQSAA